MNEIRGTLAYMGVFLAGSIGVCLLLLAPLSQAFMANQVFNAMIVAVLLVGIAVNVRQALHVGPAISWLNAFRDPQTRLAVETRPSILAPLQRLLASIHAEGFRLPTLTMRSMLDSIRTRLDESRELSRYMTGLLIFLGLLGTFWGLLDTVGSVGGVIEGLSAGEDLAASFSQLKSDLQQPLAGMGTAFSSSLFGLGGALILGFFDLQAGHAQNRFYNNLEEWLSELVHLPAGGTALDGERPAAPAYTGALLEQTAEQLRALSESVIRHEEDRRSSHERLVELSTGIAELTSALRIQERLLQELGSTQLDLKPVVERLMDIGRADQALLDQVRNLDSTVSRIEQEMRDGRAELSDGLRSELRLVARTLSTVPAHETPPGDGAAR